VKDVMGRVGRHGASGSGQGFTVSNEVDSTRLMERSVRSWR
jgi:hypothetical protein